MSNPAGTHLPSLLQLIASVLAALASFGISALVFVFGLMALAGGSAFAAQEALPIFALAWSALFIALLMLPSAVFAGLRLAGRPQPSWQWTRRYLLVSGLLMLWPLLVAIAIPISRTGMAWLLLPPLLIAGVAIPIWWYLESGRFRLPVGQPQRTWGIVTFSTLVTMPLTFLVEIAIFLFIIVGAGVWIESRPEIAQSLVSAFRVLSDMSSVTDGQVAELLSPVLQQPVFLYAVVFVVALLMPLVEELLKPLAVWMLPLAGIQPTPVQGFWTGMLSGATFALIETLGSLGSASGSDLAVVLVARLGTGLLHIVTTGLTGWALASTWRDGRYGRLLGTYLLAVLIHSAWNLFGVMVGFSPLISGDFPSTPLLDLLGRFSVPALAFLILVNLVILFRMNRRLRLSGPDAAGGQI